MRRHLAHAACSLLLFLITAATFSSLGVVLPRMVQDLGWSWGGAGLGFTLLGAVCGASSLLPALLIRRAGVRATVIAGAAVMAAGFLLLARAQGLPAYWAGAALLGAGFQMTALIPGTHVLAALYTHRGLAFGAYFTAGSLGGVAGPLLAVALAGADGAAWRPYWLIMAAATLAVGVLCAAAIPSRAALAAAPVEGPAEALAESEPTAHPAPAAPRSFTVREALATPQFYVLLAAYFSHLLCGATVSSLAPAHLTERGVAAAVAAGVLSIEGVAATAARLLGGVVADRVDARALLVASQALLFAGMLFLSFAGSGWTLGLFALGTGAGFGLTVLAVTLLLLRFYGPRHNLEIFSLTCTVGAVSALGPVIGGLLKDRLGAFQPTFVAFTVIMGLVLAAALALKPPRPRMA